MKKFIVKTFSIFFVFFMIASGAFAMMFSQPAKIGELGFPAQAPYHGFIIKGETQNTDEPYFEEIKDPESKEPLKSYTKGIARFGVGENALFCDYDFNAKDFARSIKFGGENNYIVALNGTDKEIFKIENTDGIALYAIYHQYCVSELNIIGKQKNGKWVEYINSKNISQKYFDGKDAYKEDGGVIYDKPICRDDSLIVVYRRWYWKGMSAPEGEFRFKWDDNAQWFGIEQIVY